ncbi:GNAT family protein [Streptomyces sp. NPDC004680]|uniref:GNAT family N-acetyltransferase n=1 Tax=unclassified Streptomyces TaxID=2593676 RepID=UPI0033AC2610
MGDRFAIAVLEAQSDAADGQVVGHVVLKEAAACRPSAEVGCWTAAHARGRGARPRAPEAVSGRAFDALGADGPERLKLLHQVDNPASCRVAPKIGHGLDSFLPAAPPLLPREGHPHIRRSGDGAPYRCRP